MKRKSIPRLVVTLILTAMLLVSSNFAYASSNNEISTMSYYGTDTFIFYSVANKTNFYDGTFMAIEASATSSTGNSETITIKVYIVDRDVTKTYTIKTDGTTKKFDYIYLGLGSGSDVRITTSCSNSSAKITMSLTSYSW